MVTNRIIIQNSLGYGVCNGSTDLKLACFLVPDVILLHIFLMLLPKPNCERHQFGSNSD